MKIALLGASFDTGNMGVSALAAGCMTCILESFPEAEISLLDYGKEEERIPFTYRGGRHIAIRRINMRFSKQFYLPNNIAVLILLALIAKLIPFQKLRKGLIERNGSLREISECNFIGSISGGDSFSDIYGMARMLYSSLPQILVVLLGKKLILLPQTIGPFESRIARAIARFILRRAQIIYSRDHRGLNDARTLIGRPVPKGEIRFCYDVAFGIDPVRPPQFQFPSVWKQLRDSSPMVGLNVSGLLFMGGYNGKNMFSLGVDYKTLLGHTIDFLIGKGARVLLIPHVFGTHCESDALAIEAIYPALESRFGYSIGVVRGNYDYAQIKSIIGQCDFFIGARMHACIAAVSQTIPTVPIAYSDKFIGVMETLGIAECVIDPRTMNEEQMLHIVGRAFEQRMKIRDVLETRMPQVKQAVMRLFEDMSLPDNKPERSEFGTVPVRT